MRRALDDARLAFGTGDVPVAALVIDEHGEVIGTGRNERELRHDPTAHAEVLALREAAATRDDWHLEGCTLVVTLEPCVMCAGAVLAARVPTVVFGAWDEKAGAAGRSTTCCATGGSTTRSQVFAGVLAEECGEAAARLLPRQALRRRCRGGR